MSGEAVTEPLLRCEFKRDSLNLTDNPLQFVIGEVTSIVERMPDSYKLEVNTANKITVLIFTE
jgi:hypothetical protein